MALDAFFHRQFTAEDGTFWLRGVIGGIYNNPTRTTRPREAFILIVRLVSWWIAFGFRLVPRALRMDFLDLYTGASLAWDWDWHHMYTEAGQLAPDQKEAAPARQGIRQDTSVTVPRRILAVMFVALSAGLPFWVAELNLGAALSLVSFIGSFVAQIDSRIHPSPSPCNRPLT